MGRIRELTILLGFLDYASGYLMLKIARTIVLSTLVLIAILFVRKIQDIHNGGRNPVARLYVRAYLWLVVLPVPFMGGLKLIPGHFRIRNHIYIVLYEKIMAYRIIGKLYFLGIIITAAILVFRKIRLRSWVKRLPVLDDISAYGIEKNDIPGVQVRTTELIITPFTIGLWRPVIVLPEYILRSFDKEEIGTVLQHECCHIKRGHLFAYGILELFRIFWFVNPLVHICAKRVKDDLEMICDYAVIRGKKYRPENYAFTLLKTISYCGKTELDLESHSGVPAFLGESSLSIMKRRIKLIMAYCECPIRYVRQIYVGAGILLCLLFFLVKWASYPAYTPYLSYSLYSMDGRQRIFGDNPAFDEAIERRDTGLLVNNRKVKELLQDAEIYNDKGEYWIYYGGYMKLPGTGGGGDLLYYGMADAAEERMLVPYNEKDRFAELVDWIWKHM